MLQSDTKCTDTTLVRIIELFSRHTGLKACAKDLHATDEKMRKAAGCSFIRLNGCPCCGEHVYGQGDQRTHCPHVKEDGQACGHARYDENDIPFEEVFYFPLIPRLKALLQTKQFRKLIQHEFERPRNRDIISDIYDTPAWRDFVGQASEPVARIILQFCIDAIPAFAAGTLSLKPAEFIILSLPPALRGLAKNILLYMLIPSTMKEGQKKYYDFAATYELNELYTQGLT